MKATLQGTAGIAVIGKVRARVSFQQFRGDDVLLWEGSGWLSRPFAVRGSREAVESFAEWLRAQGWAGKVE